MAEKQHSELGASICERWWNCPGSVALSRGYPNRQTEAARKGTAAHAVAEECLQREKAASEYVGWVFSPALGTLRSRRDTDKDDEVIAITEEMAADVDVYLEDCAALQEALPGLQVEVEVQFDLSPLGPPAPMFGTADFVAYSPTTRTLYVKDYKNGYLHVKETSPQLRYYAIGAALMLGRTNPIEHVEVTVVQPNGRAADVRRASYTVHELVDWARDLLAHARATQDPNAPLAPGDWCRFCPASADCTARAGQALEVARIQFANHVALPATIPDEVRLMSPERKAEVLTKAAMLSEWLKAVQASALEDLRADPNSVPGWKLVPKRPVRSWKGEVGKTLELLGVDPYKPREVVSPAQAEAALEPSMPGKTKKARTEAAKEALAALIIAESSGPTLAPASDPRPALLPAAAAFPVITEEAA